jgi:hypothetical protein
MDKRTGHKYLVVCGRLIFLAAVFEFILENPPFRRFFLRRTMRPRTERLLNTGRAAQKEEQCSKGDP